MNEKDEFQVNFIAQSLEASSHIGIEIWTELIAKCAKIERKDACEAAFMVRQWFRIFPTFIFRFLSFSFFRV